MFKIWIRDRKSIVDKKIWPVIHKHGKESKVTGVRVKTLRGTKRLDGHMDSSLAVTNLGCIKCLICMLLVLPFFLHSEKLSLE